MGKTGHGRAFEPLSYHLIEREQTALASASGVGEIDRCRVEPLGLRSIAIAARAVTAGAIFQIDLGSAPGIWSVARREGHRVGGEEVRRESARLASHLAGVRLRCDRRLELSRFTDKASPRRGYRKRFDPLANGGGKLGHLGIFDRARHRAIRDGSTIVDRNIVQQAPDGLDFVGISAGLCRRHDEAADCSERDQQREKAAGGGHWPYCPGTVDSSRNSVRALRRIS